MKSVHVRYDEDLTKRDMENYHAKLKEKVAHTPRFHSLECNSCNRCKKIDRVKNTGFNLNHGNGYMYFIKCDDGYTRKCEVGDRRPTDCLKWEEGFNEFMENSEKERIKGE
jgi:hypothetical protein